MIKKLLLFLFLLALPLQLFAATTWVQTDFKFRNDDGTEVTATQKANVNTAYTQAVTDTNASLRVRIAAKQTGTTAAALTGRLYISKNGGAYAQASATATTGCKVIDSANLTDNDATTQQLSAGTFVAGKVDDVNGQTTATGNLAQNNVTEHEYMLQLVWAQLKSGDYFDFREYNSTTAFTTYTNTGRLTVNIKISTLTDNFNDNSIDAAKWGVYTDAGTTLAETNSQIEISTTTLLATYGQLDAKAGYDLTGSQATIKIVDAGDQVVYNELVPISLRADDADVSKLTWFISQGTLYAKKTVASSTTDVASTSYVAATHRYLRIREASGTTYWDYSSDGLSWTNLGSVANPITITNLYPIILYYRNANVTTTTAKIDDFNILPSAVRRILIFE